MRIEHLAIWTNDIEVVKDFYVKYFSLQCSDKYVNPGKNFSSYFLTFGDDKTRIEIMHRPDISSADPQKGSRNGLAHFAISVGSKTAVDLLTENLRADGFTVYGEPRTTGDGYYESVVLDPEGNHVEITE